MGFDHFFLAGQAWFMLVFSAGMVTGAYFDMFTKTSYGHKPYLQFRIVHKLQ